MNDKTEVALLAGAAAIVVGFVALGGRSQSNGFSYTAPNPNSVAAVENGIAADIKANNDAINARASLGANLLLGLTAFQTQLQARQIDASTSLALENARDATAIQVTGLQTSAAMYETNSNNGAAVEKARLTAEAQQRVAQISADANTSIARTAADNKTTQVQAQAGAQKQGNLVGGVVTTISNVLGFLGKLFGI